MNAPVTQQEQMSITLVPTAGMLSTIRERSGALEVAQAYVIDSNDMAQIAVNERNGFLKAIEELKVQRNGFTEDAEKIIARAKALFNPAINALDAGVKLLNERIVEWTQKEKARIALENQQREDEARKLRQEAEQKAAAERARAQEKADEEARKAKAAEEARLKAIAEGDARGAAAAAAEKAKAEEKGKAALESGEAKATEAHLAAAAAVTNAAPVEQAKFTGNQLRTNWTYRLRQGITEEQAKAQIANAIAGVEIVDGKRVLCQPRPELLAFSKTDTSALGKGAKTFKAAFNVPGYEAFDDPIAAGSKK